VGIAAPYAGGAALAAIALLILATAVRDRAVAR
jgi:hypothetical protein